MEKIGHALFYCRVNRDDKANSGVIKKCIGQVEGLRALGWKVDMVWLCNDGVLMNERLIYKFKYPIQLHSLRTYFIYFIQWHSILKRHLDFQKYQMVYARYELSHRSLISFFKTIKLENPSLKIILEIPTYPYHKELKGLIRKAQLLVDVAFRSKLKRYVDFIVTYGEQKKIFGVQALPSRNRINIKNVPTTRSVLQNNEIRLIAVGYWRFWHGLDRLIEGIANYYDEQSPSTTVSLHIIGEGEELKKLKDLCSEYQLEKWVKFSPPISEKGLDNLFNEADIGIGSLGLHRIGLQTATPLKHREYCARNLPFILSTPDLDFTEQLAWVYYFPANESLISIPEIIYFFSNWKAVLSQGQIREYAENKLSWQSFFEEVLKKCEIQPRLA